MHAVPELSLRKRQCHAAVFLLPFISVQSWKMNVHAESSFLSFSGLPVRDRIAQTNPDFPLGISHFPG
jgi:hypothetical protein